MGGCNGKPRRLNSQKLIDVDENETLTFEITLNNLKGRNFKKVSLEERHSAVDQVCRPERSTDPHCIQSLESRGKIKSGRTHFSSAIHARLRAFTKKASEL